MVHKSCGYETVRVTNNLPTIKVRKQGIEPLYELYKSHIHIKHFYHLVAPQGLVWSPHDLTRLSDHSRKFSHIRLPEAGIEPAWKDISYFIFSLTVSAIISPVSTNQDTYLFWAPHASGLGRFLYLWRDSNSHASFQRPVLNRMCIPFHHRGI